MSKNISARKLQGVLGISLPSSSGIEDVPASPRLGSERTLCLSPTEWGQRGGALGCRKCSRTGNGQEKVGRFKQGWRPGQGLEIWGQVLSWRDDHSKNSVCQQSSAEDAFQHPGQPAASLSSHPTCYLRPNFHSASGQLQNRTQPLVCLH